jgi:dipeptidyl aminopeptidase/acylaminoacyl peptidase
MRPEDLSRFVTLSDPRIHPDGSRVAFVVSRMNLDDDRYDRQIWIWDGEEARPFTHGPGDARPRWSPDGSRLAFIRTGPGKEDRPQVAVMPVTGGEAAVVTDFALGASEAEWSPDGSSLAVVGVSWTEDWSDVEDEERARKPRRIGHFGYRFDDAGYLFDKTTNVYLVDPAGGEPTRLTTGEYRNAAVAWRPDGSAVGFISARHERRSMDGAYQVYEAATDGSGETPLTDLGGWALLSYAPDGTPHLIGIEDPASYPAIYRVWRVDENGPVELASQIDRNFAPPAPPVSPAGPQWIGADRFLSALEDRGRIRVVTVAGDGSVTDFIGGDRLITGASPRPDGSAVAFVATTFTDPGELYWWEDGEERVLTSMNEAFRSEVPLVEPVAFTAVNDGVEIDAWALLPEGDGAVPLLLNIHGGPATQYGYGFFDEFQVYAGAGYGVVACNPRGSSGRGLDFVRTPVGRWHEERSPDLRDILTVVDEALDRFDRLDADRMGIMGGSYGGLMTVKILGVDDRWKSAVPERGLYSFMSFAGTSDIAHSFPRRYLGDWSYDDWEILWQSSPLRVAHRITTPCLIIHAEGDWRCPIEQAEQLHSVLLGVGTEAEMLRFPGASHELSRSGKPKWRKERFEAIVEWHDRHLTDVTT